MKRDPILVMYNALMAIGAIDARIIDSQTPLARAQQIAHAALREMNVDHIVAVQKALGILK